MPSKNASKFKGPVKYEPIPFDSSFILRLPRQYTAVLDGLVEKGAAKSRNDLIVEIIKGFIETLGKEAEATNSG